MFNCIAHGQILQLQELGERLLSAHTDSAAALLCLDHVFNKPVKVQSAGATEAASTLRAFLTYCREMQRIALEPNPGPDSTLSRLFGFQNADGAENTYILPSGTFMHTYHFRRLGDTAPADETQPLAVNDWDLTNLFRTALRERLRRRINDENFLCAKARAIFPCPTLALFGTCNSNDCSRGHQENAALDTGGYHLRVRLIFQQILIYQTISGLENRSTVAGQQRYVIVD